MKVVTAAIAAGLLVAVFSISLAFISFVIVGLATFTFQTANGLEPPSQEFTSRVLERVRGPLTT